MSNDVKFYVDCIEGAVRTFEKNLANFDIAGMKATERFVGIAIRNYDWRINGIKRDAWDMSMVISAILAGEPIIETLNK